MQQGNTSSCSFCGAGKEDIEHVLWDCPRWEALRTLPRDVVGVIRALPPGSRLCGHALSSFSEDVARQWNPFQEQAARIIEQHQKEICKKRRQKQEAPSPSKYRISE